MRKTLHEFVIDVYDKADATLESCATALDYVNDYAKLTNRAPRLRDFISCDEQGKPITLSERGEKSEHERVEEQNRYQEAIGRVIFQGEWEVCGRHGYEFVLGDGRINILLSEYNRIKDLPREIEFKEGVI